MPHAITVNGSRVITSATTEPFGPLSVQYGYDSVGNRSTTTLDAGLIMAVYGATNNRLESMSGALPAGYMLGASNVAFTYLHANRLVGIQADGANVASYLVNGLGQRVQKSAGG